MYQNDTKPKNRGNRVKETTKNKTQSYVYDGTNRLVRGVNTDGDASEYTYNALLMRVYNTQVAKSGNVYARDYVIDYTSGDENNDLVVYAHGEYYQQHVYLKVNGHGERLMQLTDTTAAQSGNGGQERKLYIHEDPLWTTKKFTKGDGTEFAALRYDAWGLPVRPNKLVNNDRGNFIAANFTGHTYDTVLDFYFAEARHYDPQGRIWVARDPAKDGLNWYRYVENNPATYNDPTGKVINLVAAAVGAGVGAAVGFLTTVIPSAVKGEEINWRAAGAAAAGGAATGGLAGLTMGASLVVTGVGLGIAGAVGSATEQIIADGSVDWGQASVAAAMSLGTFGLARFLPTSGFAQAASKFFKGGCQSISAGVKRAIYAFKDKISPRKLSGNHSQYSHLPDSQSVGAGKDFTRAQKQAIIEENARRNNGEVKSDLSGDVLVKPSKSQKGVTPPENEWQIDHITPKDKGGTNSYSNAQVLSRAENRAKANK